VLLALGRPVLIGFSRKSSLRKLVGGDDLVSASVAAAVTAFERGATILRVHDVKEHVDALTVASALSGHRLDGARPGAEVPALPAPERE
jgi:dihydropteroate synthase